VILCAQTGTGKTLTSEVYASSAKWNDPCIPFSAPLGTDADDLENTSEDLSPGFAPLERILLLTISTSTSAHAATTFGKTPSV